MAPLPKPVCVVGDRVINVDGKPFSGTKLNVERISKTFRGEKDTHIALGILRDQSKSIKDFNIKRDRVSLSSVDAAFNVGDAGYVKISKFASTTDTDFRSALKKLKADGMQKLVLDLRGNGGGYLNTATAMADEFLPNGKLIVYTQGSHEPRTDYFATDSGSYEKGDLTVIIDEYSASASEILAGALQDLDRATIVGRRSFGKGLVQQQFPFGDGTAINLTVARYYTPSGRSIQKSYKNGIASYRNELANRIRKVNC
jgi:carboxyl-terminal processing protease